MYGVLTDNQVPTGHPTPVKKRYNPSSYVHTGQYLKSIGLKLHPVSEPLSQQIIKDYFKIMVARDPYVRLMSAYQDKLLPYKEGRVQRKLDGPIRKRYKVPLSRAISFTELLKYVKDVGHFSNIHFRPIHDLCQPCTIPYDFIAKVESIDSDAEYIIHDILQSQLSVSEVLNQSSGPSSTSVNHKSSSDAAHEAYGSVSDSIKQGVKDFCQADVMLFGYNSTKWLGF